MRENLLEVSSIDTRHSDKANCDYKVVTFKGVSMIGNRTIKSNVAATRNLWPTHDVTLADGKVTSIKGDVEFDTILIGDAFGGKVFRTATTPYTLEGRQITQWTGVIFEHENPLVVAARNLQQNNAAPIDESTGQPFQLVGSKVNIKALEPVADELP